MTLRYSRYSLLKVMLEKSASKTGIQKWVAVAQDCVVVVWDVLGCNVRALRTLTI
jgi:hypothetical protein